MGGRGREDEKKKSRIGDERMNSHIRWAKACSGKEKLFF